MADTIREKILANIKTTLEEIKIANGYANDIDNVQRWEQEGNSLINIPCITVSSGFEEKEKRPGLIASCKFSVSIIAWIRHDKAVFVGSTDSYLSTLVGDIEKALMADHTRGSYAVDTRVLSNVPFETTIGQPYAGLIFDIEIEYKHKLTDPTQQA